MLIIIVMLLNGYKAKLNVCFLIYLANSLVYFDIVSQPNCLSVPSVSNKEVINNYIKLYNNNFENYCSNLTPSEQHCAFPLLLCAAETYREQSGRRATCYTQTRLKLCIEIRHH